MRWQEQVRRRLCHEAWNIGFVRQGAADIVRHGMTAPVAWFAGRPGELLADPAYFRHPDGTRTLYAERVARRQERGEIWAADLAAGQDIEAAVFRRLLHQPFHLSYPQPFAAEDGTPMLTAESWQANAALLWRPRDGPAPDAKPLFAGRPVIDPTLWFGGGRVWLFCTFRDDGPDHRLHLFHAGRLGDPWVAHPANPVKQNARSARPAGPLFLADGVLVRPAQDCSQTYGGAVTLNAVTTLDPDAYAEEPIRRLDPVPGPYGRGLHTFCPAGNDTIIDGKAWRHDPLVLARRLRHKLAALLGQAPARGPH